MPSKSVWNSSDYQRVFLDSVAIKFAIKKPSDWGNITNKVFTEEGGSTLLRKFNGSIANVLSNAYPDINWKKSREGKLQGYWTLKENQHKFLEDLALQLRIKKPSEWGKITINQVIDHGGRSLLHHYGSSLQKALQANFPNIAWKREWFTNANKYSSGYWREKSNQRNFFKEIEKKLNIREPSDWKYVSRKQVLALGGYSALQYYGHSLPNALRNVYPDIKWKKEWFPSSKYSSNFWSTNKNERIFLDEIAKEYNIKDPSEWQRVSLSLIRMHGGHGLLKKYNYSLQSMLSNIYHQEKWTSFTLSRSGPQILVLEKLGTLFPVEKY